MGTSVRGKNKLSEAHAPVLRSKKRHSHCDLPIQTEDISRPREERDLGFFAVATPQWRAHALPGYPAAHTSNELLALCKLLTQSAGVDAGIGLLERTPFHRCS